MPIYEYECKCGATTERIEDFEGVTPPVCDECKTPMERVQVSLPAPAQVKPGNDYASQRAAALAKREEGLKRSAEHAESDAGKADAHAAFERQKNSGNL